ncbi:MAG: hypothetical protein ACE5JQ_00790 [Candidatus Methylomirabilales bacterium]
MARKIGALWLRTSQDGQTFLSGVISDIHGEIPITVFRNDRKGNENHPDYNIVLSAPPKENLPPLPPDTHAPDNIIR